MGEAKVILTAEDKASSIIDHVTKKLGIFNREGIAMGVSFAIVNKAIELVSRGFQFLAQSFTDGINRAMDFELNLVRLTNTIDDMDMSVGDLSASLHNMSNMYGVSVNDMAVNMRMLTRQGMSAAESIKILNQANLLVLTSGEDLASVIDALDTVMGVFNYDVSESGFIFKKLNDIWGTTNYSFQQIADIISRESPKIIAAGWDINDVANALYTLGEAKVGSRTLGPEFEKLLDGISAIKMKTIPEGRVKPVEETASAAINTNKKAIDVIGAAWDGLWEGVGQGALDTVDFLKMVFTKQLPTKTVLPGLGDISQPKENPLKAWVDSQVEAAKNMPTLNTEIYDIRGQMKYMTAMRGATLEVDKQRDAIAALTRISKQYNLEQQQMSLEIMKIQYGARGRRGGRLTRGEQREIYNIETDMMAVQIKEAENQIAIGQIQVRGLQDALDAQDILRRQHDTDVYNEELSALQTELDAKLVLWRKYYAAINAMNPLVKTTGSSTTPEQTMQNYNRSTRYRSYYDWKMRIG